jgi:hypothetical protein
VCPIDLLNENAERRKSESCIYRCVLILIVFRFFEATKNEARELLDRLRAKETQG